MSSGITPTPDLFATFRFAQVDIRAEQIEPRASIDLGVVGDVGPMLTAFLPRLEGNRDRRHLDQATEHYHKTRKGLDDLAVANQASGPSTGSKLPMPSATRRPKTRS